MEVKFYSWYWARTASAYWRIKYESDLWKRHALVLQIWENIIQCLVGRNVAQRTTYLKSEASEGGKNFGEKKNLAGFIRPQSLASAVFRNIG